MAPLEEILEVMVAGESKTTADYLEKLFGSLQEILLSKESGLKQVVLTPDAPRFHYCIGEKMFLEIQNGAELYVMDSKSPKEGKVYVFTPHHWNSGRIFLILEEHLQDLEPN